MSLNFSIIAKVEEERCFDHNITHNLTTMAKKAGIYNCLWGEFGKHASDIINTLEEGIKKLESNPEYYRQFDSDNGWGLYNDFLPWLKNVLNDCKLYPHGAIERSM